MWVRGLCINMDFKIVLGALIDDFNKENIRYALIGGFALGALGIPRATVDLDFLVEKDDLPKVDKIVASQGYECVFKSENVSQYISPLKIFGEVDFLHAFRKIAVSMLERALELDIFDGSLKIKVLRPEDIIGLKIQAVANDETRETQEYADIEALISYYRKNLKWDIIEEYFSLFEKEEKFNDLKRKYYNVN